WVEPFRTGFSFFIGAFAAIGLYEYYAIVRARAISPETIGGILAGTLVALSGHFNNLVATNLVLYGGCLLVFALHIVRGSHSVAGLASSVFGVFYIGWFTAHILMLHASARVGPGLVLLLFVAVFFTDVGAYFTGAMIGRHKLAPKVSPQKTWEGAVGGFALALAGVVALYALRRSHGWAALPDWPLGGYVYAGGLLSLTAQIGDLGESCLKRDAGVKDSGIILPGHGGILDRCDGLLLAAPVLYYIVTPLCTN
ncbi:MAG TPA: phosphatidate cytidylyltransferase, partial [Candidatus Hydrogenedentes bacterium]|nr:phosphatidate cytidylyltransferase [Candidatus Hydrogenedentota bacterium]